MVIKDNIGQLVILTSHHRQQPGGLPLADGYDGGGEEEGNGGGGRHQPAVGGGGLPPGEVCEVVEEEDGEGDLKSVSDDID